jgi:ABC-type antimicrobial peptide transport system permease subunit
MSVFVLLSMALKALRRNTGVIDQAEPEIATRLHGPRRLSLNAIGVAFGCAAAIGITFGFYPAMRAARLDPIDAIRVE